MNVHATAYLPAHLRRTPRDALADHRIAIGQKKRELMLRRIIAATIKVFSTPGLHTPVIEDVVREAKISRGTFYVYFDSLTDALVATGIEANAQAIADILPVYDCLKEPWQRIAVRFRAFLVRALQDPTWATFVTRMDAWPLEARIAIYMSADLQRGREAGQFRFDDLDAAIAFIMGASAGGIQALRNGVPQPTRYIDASVSMMLQSVGCSAELAAKALAFSRKHLSDWESGERQLWTAL